MKTNIVQFIGILIVLYIPSGNLNASESISNETGSQYSESHLPSQETKDVLENMQTLPSEQNLRAAGGSSDPNNDDEPELGLPVSENVSYLLIPFAILYIVAKKKSTRKREKETGQYEL